MANVLYDALVAPLSGDDTPLIFVNGETVTRAAFFAAVETSAAGLVAAGVRPGDRVCVQAAKSLDMLSVYLAAFWVGAVFVPLNTAYTPRELDHFLTDSMPALFLTDPDRVASLHEVVPGEVVVKTIGGADDFRVGVPDIPVPVVDALANTPAALLYTSGTTGRAKGAVLTHGNLIANATALTACWKFGPGDVLLHALPIFHAHGLFVATNVTLLAGGKLWWLPEFHVDQVFDALPHVTAMMGVPTYYTRMANDARLTPDVAGHIRVFISGSAPLTNETFDAFHAATGKTIVERYGMTETGMLTSNLLHDARRGTVGKALGGVTVRVVGADGVPVKPYEKGMVHVAGANVFGGYWQRDDANKAAFTKDGFFVTGDLGMFDADGYLTLVGRETDLIISGGLNVYPTEVEQLLALVPGVVEVAVVGVPHPDFGEAVIAVIVADATFDEDVLHATARTALANFKRPKRVFVCSELPRNALGKVQKNLLRNTYKDTFETV